MISATTSIEFQILMQIILLMQINGTVGYNMLQSMLEYTEVEIQTGMSANFESAFHTWQLAYPLLKASGNGSILNVSLLLGTVACWPGALYGGMQGHHYHMFRCFCSLLLRIYTCRQMGFQ
jgi:NAD(P)-dependent dehydrogenase (short-subunit alcohol dehydrogenase family)